MSLRSVPQARGGAAPSCGAAAGAVAPAVGRGAATAGPAAGGAAPAGSGSGRRDGVATRARARGAGAAGGPARASAARGARRSKARELRTGFHCCPVERQVRRVPHVRLPVGELRPGAGRSSAGAARRASTLAPADVVPAARGSAAGTSAVASADANDVASVDDLHGTEAAAGAAGPSAAAEVGTRAH